MRPKALIVEDDPTTRLLLRKMVEAQCCDVEEAPDGGMAIALLDKNEYSVVLLDIVLPDVDGVELCRAFKSHPTTRDIPIILLTGTASSTSAKVKGFKAGADDYVLKPFEMEELIERVIVVTGLNISEIRKLFPTVCNTLPKPVMPTRLVDSIQKCLMRGGDEHLMAI